VVLEDLLRDSALWQDIHIARYGDQLIESHLGGCEGSRLVSSLYSKMIVSLSL
jgi:hypothetical protein